MAVKCYRVHTSADEYRKWVELMTENCVISGWGIYLYTTMKVVSLVDPKTAINMSLGPEKVLVIRNSGTVALSGPTTIDLYRGTFGTRKKWS